MRLLPGGPEIPDELVRFQEEGQTIFVCGAGVSRTIGLPLFRGLVERIYQELGEDWNLHPAEREGMRTGGLLEGQYDRVLRCLERRLAASDLPRNQGMKERIRSAVRNVLSPPEKPDLSNHLALLHLSRDPEGRIRILTTNFDTVFERAWFDQHQTCIASHAGTAMPRPKVSGFAGVLHLHGRLADTDLRLEETDLVLTSAEFGDAYLRSGWASRYVYDLVRTHTFVLVGYQADDPPMRYLLEALEADRERYPDLRQVYAFASSSAGEEEVNRALWRAKGVEPVLYTISNGDHSPLYHTLREWKKYADDPTAWRRERLRDILSESATAVAEERVDECVSLLRHGDAPQLLGELAPEAEWLPLLADRGVFNGDKAHPGLWIAKRINDPQMIRACAALPSFDERAHWFVDRAVGRDWRTLSAVRLKAWQIILAAKRPGPRIDLDFTWYISAQAIKEGRAGYDARRLVASILRPRLEIRKPWREAIEDGQTETLHHLLRIEFQSARSPKPEEILETWPRSIEQEIALLRVLDHAVVDALEEASDADILDQASWDVPSVAAHPQNAHHSGFYPITRALADLWDRVAAQDRGRAHMLAVRWRDSPYPLTQRFYLYALQSQEIFAPEEAASALRMLDDDVFWLSGAQVEIMRLLTNRWHEFSQEQRNALEFRIAEGIPRSLFPDDAFDDQAKWESIWDAAVFKRLKRISAAGGELSVESLRLLEQVAARHPNWQPSPGDRDDFMTWMGETSWGPQGHPELLGDVADEALVKEAMRLQLERPFEEGDVWRLFCSADPERALSALRLAADDGEWDSEAWRPLLWTAQEKGEAEFQIELADHLCRMPPGPLRELLPSATSWLQKRRETLTTEDGTGGPRFLRLWDIFADSAYGQEDSVEIEEEDDLVTRALNEPGGILAWTLVDSLSASNPERDSRLGLELTPRFSRVVDTQGRAGLLGRVYLARALAYLDAIDSKWTHENLVPRLASNNPEAAALWKAHADDQIGSARLFNTLKPEMLRAFEREDVSGHELEALVGKLLDIDLAHRQGKAGEYELSPVDIRRALTVGPPAVRQHAAWRLWRLMWDDDGVPLDKAERWSAVVGPLFRQIWPLDARLRSEDASRNLILMALECEGAFPDAVDAIIDFLVPHRFFRISLILKLEQKHGVLIKEYPAASLRLANALIDPTAHPVPDDLAEFLHECVSADPRVVNESAYIRLYGLRRQSGA